MSQPDPRSVARIAIALAALKFKPKDQSTTSYLFDLQSRFTSVTNSHSSRDWQTYALELEGQLSTFKAQRDADHALLSKLLTETTRAGLTSDAPPPLKKSKKNTSKDQQDPEWSWHQIRADWSRFLSSQCPSSSSLIAAYAFLEGVLASPGEDHVHISRLTDAMLRVLDAIHVFLFSSNTDPGFHTETVLGTLSQLNPRHIDSPRIAITSPLLMYFLRTAFPALLCSTRGVSNQSKRHRQYANSAVASIGSHANIDRVLDRILECVLLPLLRALAPLCFARFAPLVPPFKRPSRLVMKAKNTDRAEKDKRSGASFLRPPKGPDARTDAFALIGTSLEALDALPSLPGNLASSIRDRLALETIRELETLYANSLSHLNSPESFPGSASASQQPAMAQPIPSPLSVQPHSQSRSQGGLQQSALNDLRMKRLEKLVGSREERIRALATRDAGWFLASALNLCVTPAPMPTARTGPSHCEPIASRTDYAGQQLKEVLLDRIWGLIRSVQHSNHHTNPIAANSKPVIDPICENMLLAICERTMTQLVS